MKQFPFKKIDAFATDSSDGNPAGYIRLDALSDIDNEGMLRIARECKGFVNEVGYIAPISERSFSLRFFSAEREVDLCGHATIGIMYDLLQSEKQLSQFESLEITTNRGVLSVENHLPDEDAVFITAPVPFDRPVPCETREIAEALKISPGDIASEHDVSIINAGLTTLLVPIRTLAIVLETAPDLEELKSFCIRADIDIIEVFTDEVADERSDYRTRVFAPRFGYLEDPATGTGNSALGYYLHSRGMFDKETIIIEQNGERSRFNIVKVRKKYDEETGSRILFGGGAITRIEGVYFLQ